jgi:glycosyltransferase involved in cell wall biosynthesis
MILLEKTFLNETSNGISTVIKNIIKVFDENHVNYRTVSYYDYFKRKTALFWYIYYNVLINIKIYNLKKGDVFFMPANLGGMFFMLRGKGACYILIYDLFEMSECSNKLKRKINKMRFSVIIKGANKIITISDHIYNNIKEKFPNAIGKIYNVYLFVDKNNFQKSGDNSRFLSEKVIQSVNKGKYFLANGSGQERKNIAFLIENMQQLYADFGNRLILMGKDFHGNGYKEVFKEIEKFHCENLIIHLGEISQEELFFLYKNASCFIFPSLKEGFGLPPLEALVCGSKIAVSNIPIFEEIYSEMECLFEYNYNSLKKTLENVLNEDNYLFNNKKNIILSRFSYERYSKELIRIFK